MVITESNWMAMVKMTDSNVDVNRLQIQDQDTTTMLSTDKPEGFIIADPVTFNSNVKFQQDVFTTGNLTGNSINIWKASNVGADTAEVGYGFRITPSQQLELVKYTKASDSTLMYKRIMMFSSATSSSSSSDTDAYMVFDTLDGVSQWLSNIAAAFVASNLSVFGYTTVHGNVIPTTNGVTNLGVLSASYQNIYLSHDGSVYFGKSRLGYNSSSGGSIAIRNSNGEPAYLDAYVDSSNVLGLMTGLQTFDASNVTSGVFDASKLPSTFVVDSVTATSYCNLFVTEILSASTTKAATASNATVVYDHAISISNLGWDSFAKASFASNLVYSESNLIVAVSNMAEEAMNKAMSTSNVAVLASNTAFNCDVVLEFA